jgi:hypothetical protein
MKWESGALEGDHERSEDKVEGYHILRPSDLPVTCPVADGSRTNVRRHVTGAFANTSSYAVPLIWQHPFRRLFPVMSALSSLFPALEERYYHLFALSLATEALQL